MERNYEYIDPGVDAGAVPLKLWKRGVSVEPAAIAQLTNAARLPFMFHHIAGMPDCHWGMGGPVGGVMATTGAIVPAFVGVDIGCGMMAVRTSLTASDLPDNLHAMRTEIEAAVPHGRTDNGGVNDRGAWGDVQTIPPHLMAGLRGIVDKHPKLEQASTRAAHHIGTLGTGNHFIEVCVDEEQRVWIMLHSGSRGIGNKIGSYFIERAKAHMRRWFINLPDEDLAYLPEGEQDFADYVEAVHWGQEFALANREAMMAATLGAIQRSLMRVIGYGEIAVNCHHNYVAKEHHFGKNVWLTRKGAVRARTDDLGIIPGSMGVQSFIVRGLGNPESFHSCSHGAGRAMSRAEARKRFSLEDHALATAGVECRKDAEVIDETPGAYKPIGAVMEAQSDLVEIVHTLKQVCCVKG